MRIGDYEVRLLTGNVKRGLVRAAGVALWTVVAYIVGATVARFTPYSIAEPWPRPLGLAVAGSAVLLAVAMVVVGIALVVDYVVAIEEVSSDD